MKKIGGVEFPSQKEAQKYIQKYKSLKKSGASGLYGKFMKYVKANLIFDDGEGLNQDEMSAFYKAVKKEAEKSTAKPKSKAKSTAKSKSKAKSTAKPKSTRGRGRPKESGSKSPKSTPPPSSGETFSKARLRKQGLAKYSASKQVMGNAPRFYVVVKEEGGKKDVIGAYINMSSAKSAASTHISSIKRAYEPFLPVGYNLSINRLGVGGKSQAGISKGNLKSAQRAKYKTEPVRAKYELSNTSGLQYLKTKLKKKPFALVVYLIEEDGDKKLWNKYGKVIQKYNSPSAGSLRWNPKRRKRRK